MKLGNAAFLFVLGLFFMQVGVAVASPHEQSHPDLLAGISCHHTEGSQQLQSSQTAEDHSCCKTGCQCSVGGCSSPAMIDYSSTEFSYVIAGNHQSIDAFVFPQMLQNSLFRPPISS